MEESRRIPDQQDEDSELYRAFQYAANRDRRDQLADLGHQMLHDQSIRRATLRSWLPWALAVGAVLFCLGFWFGRQASGEQRPALEPPEPQQIPPIAQLDSFTFYAFSGERFVVRPSTDNTIGTQPKLEVFDLQGQIMSGFYQNDTLLFLKIEQKPRPASPSRSKGQTNKIPSPLPPVAVMPHPSGNIPPQLPAILVADPNNKGRFLNSTLSAHRIRIAGEQKTTEPLPPVRVNAFDDMAMRCVFFGNQIRLSIPAKLAEGQEAEILELQGAGAEDGHYLRIGNQFFRLKTDGYSFDLSPAPKPKALD